MAFITIYDTSNLDRQQIDDYLKPTDHSWEFIEEPIRQDNLRPEAEIVSVFVSSKVTREMIAALPKLRLIACRSTGYDNVDLKACAERDIAVVNVPSYGDHTVAEFTFALLLNLSRKLHQSIHSLDGMDLDQTSLTGFDLNGKTIGIVGMGHIGQRVAQIAKGFGMTIVAYDPYPREETASEIGFAYVSLDELAAQGDVIALHTPYTRDNHHLVNREFLAKVKPTAVLINTARGELIDTVALIEALTQRRLAGAGLDVLEGERLFRLQEEVLMLGHDTLPGSQLMAGVQLDILKRMPNVVITPHNAFNTVEAINRINKTSVENMTRFWYGETPNKVVPPKQTSGKLILTRHAESEWNAQGRWTGSRDIHLSEKGFHEAAMQGLALKDIVFDYAIASQQIRSFETMEGIFGASQQFDVPYERSAAINERDYGDYTGMNKWEVKEKLGEEVFHSLRRDWDYPVPNGETLKDVYERCLPFYHLAILPRLLDGKNVLIVSHGNAIRALMKYIENISDKEIENLEMPFGNIMIYEVDAEGRMTSKTERHIETTPSAATQPVQPSSST